MDEAASYDLYAREHAAGTYGTDSLRERSGYEADLFTKVPPHNHTISRRECHAVTPSNLGTSELVTAGGRWRFDADGGIRPQGRGRILDLSPLGAYDNAAIEA